MLVNYYFNKSDKKRDAGLTTPDDIYRKNDICYGQNKKWQLLDVYYSKGTTKPLPVIVIVHGGGWVYGTKEVYQYYGMDLAKRGFVVVNFNYRLAPKHKFPAQLEDINLVIKWLYQHDKVYHMDNKHLYLVGDSAGAHLTSLYTSFLCHKDYQKQFTFKPPKGFKPTAIALNCGIYDIDHLQAHTRYLLRDLLGRRFKKDLHLINPVDYVTKDFPPVYLMTSHDDFLVDQAPFMQQQLTAHHVQHVYKVYGDDNDKLYHVFHVDIKTASAAKANDDECQFFKTV